MLAIADPLIVLLPLVTERLLAGAIFAVPTSSTKPSLLPPPSAPFDGPAIITYRMNARKDARRDELKCRRCEYR